MAFTPIQQIMLVVYNKSLAAGIRISAATLISTTFTWPMATGEYWRSHTPNSFGADGWSIGAVTQAFQDLVEMGELPNTL
jgi:hypothetical protein